MNWENYTFTSHEFLALIPVPDLIYKELFSSLTLQLQMMIINLDYLMIFNKHRTYMTHYKHEEKMVGLSIKHGTLSHSQTQQTKPVLFKFC